MLIHLSNSSLGTRDAALADVVVDSTTGLDAGLGEDVPTYRGLCASLLTPFGLYATI